MTETATNRAIRRLADRAVGALISRRTLVRSASTGSHSPDTRNTV